jgi:PHD/YefM family antitoxin component YafN of YafNO toxin-antitoxin module
MIRIASVTELRDRLAETIDALATESAVMIVRHSKAAAYLVSPVLFEKLLERIEDLEDQTDMQTALTDYREGKVIDAEDVFGRLGL